MIYTNTVKTDGFGSQYQTIICTILYVEIQLQSEYVYSRPNLEYVYEDESEELYKLMNIEGAFRSVCDGAITIDYGICYNFVESNMDRCLGSPTMEKIRNLFLTGKTNCFDTSYINVAIHIRRISMHKNIDLQSHHEGLNVKDMEYSKLTEINQRFIHDSYYINIMDNIRSKFGPNVMFHLYSEGCDKDFPNFVMKDVVFHLNENITSTWVGMVFADILVTSASSFSYAAALLSKNTIYYKKFWHRPSPTWVIGDQ